MGYIVKTYFFIKLMFKMFIKFVKLVRTFTHIFYTFILGFTF